MVPPPHNLLCHDQMPQPQHVVWGQHNPLWIQEGTAKAACGMLGEGGVWHQDCL
jgi:hypothetical protein